MKRMAALLATAGACVAAGGTVFAAVEHVAVGTGLYWAVETGTTVGYGDVTPHDTVGRVLAVAVMLVVIPTLGTVFAVAQSAHLARRHLNDIRANVDRALRIAADTYRHHTGQDHPEAPQ